MSAESCARRRHSLDVRRFLPLLTMSTEQNKQRTCTECGSTDIAAGIRVSKTAETGSIGLTYKTLGILHATAPLYADLCRQCGTVARFFVREPDRPWIAD